MPCLPSMYWNEHDSESSSAGSSTPSSASSDLPSTLDKHSSPTLQSQTANDVLQSVLKVRKTWKTLRGGETVWPLELEAALLEGLEKYQPDDSRETRMLGRFPRRNRFISDYVFHKTGKRRSAKQVGSRLQQLRESCGDDKLMHLLSPFRHPAYPDSGDSGPNSPVSPLVEEGLFPTLSSRHTVMYIDIIPEGLPDQADSAKYYSPWSDNGEIIHASNHPRHLRSINPTVSFTSGVSLVAHSQFTVYSEDLILHAETVPLLLLKEKAPGGFLYSTRLVPKYWKTILDSPDPTRFTIFHEVFKEENSSLIFSATYKFSYPNIPQVYVQPPNSIDLAALQEVSYPAYENIMWNPSDPRLRENTPMQKLDSPSGDCYFPSNLSSYYNRCLTRGLD
ncbi:hypothetical protein DFH07DRAFT_1067010 [Mycena maculata]|uniref:TEA domain-containing protein n=1 Tax=Mycena maculata TaxID=230809 RepID=A0AAD7HNF7_9AGAR|nr:hypothetical protein DFH07DRAFT_1067010 [Mycena maculata]